MEALDWQLVLCLADTGSWGITIPELLQWRSDVSWEAGARVASKPLSRDDSRSASGHEASHSHAVSVAEYLRLKYPRLWHEGVPGLPTEPSSAFDVVGLVALFAFGLGLTALGGSILFEGRTDSVALAGATALTAPGLTASFIAGAGLLGGSSQA